MCYSVVSTFVKQKFKNQKLKKYCSTVCRVNQHASNDTRIDSQVVYVELFEVASSDS